ncbi:NmrA-like protein [Macrophomina phaseolina MS6]|uniref:NmrA-like protein n=1 Tax=Macrophomina phaseolina (strain MS6) TaxID=1126212 RepID=K2RZ13_MACPH|nr:NmrA-like protein [Macrophomina phaseolina MS6]
MAPPIVIVFGATGGVGSSTARTAQRLGAKVFIALRNTEKPIPGLTREEEKEAGFERVQADLTKPETIEAAVRQSGAKHAFIYLFHGDNDHMNASILALKAADIEFVVFLSSASVHGNRSELPPADFIPYAHAQVELALEHVFSTSGYVAIRPAFFNTNVSFWTDMFRKGEVRTAYLDAVYDWISPDDIGEASGTVLVRGIQATEGAENRNFIYLCGPKLMTLRKAIGIFSKVLGKDIKITELNEEDGVAALVESGTPEFLAKPLLRVAGQRCGPDQEGDPTYNKKSHEQAVANLRKYAGRATPLEEWAEANKRLLGA